MIKINSMKRGEGKTTKVIEMLNSDNELICIVPSKEHRTLYPKKLQDRVITYNDLRGRRVNKLVFDEGFIYKPSQLMEIYYHLGTEGIDVTVLGTE